MQGILKAAFHRPSPVAIRFVFPPCLCGTSFRRGVDISGMNGASSPAMPDPARMNFAAATLVPDTARRMFDVSAVGFEN